MFRKLSSLIPLLLAWGVGPGAVGGFAQIGSEALVHIAHVRDGFSNTPNGEGLLPVALADASVVAEHARLAASGDPTDIDPMIRHARHVLHAIDPSEFPSGPGSGFGVREAAREIGRHIALADAADGSSQNLRTHAAHVAAAARATVERADRIVDLARQIISTSDYVRAGPLVDELALLGGALIAGEDHDSDGTVSLDGEGGLVHLEQHLSLILEGEEI